MCGYCGEIFFIFFDLKKYVENFYKIFFIMMLKGDVENNDVRKSFLVYSSVFSDLFYFD